VVPPITWSVLVQYMKSEVQNTNSVMTKIVFMINYFLMLKVIECNYLEMDLDHETA
jgi:hypothetical protein